MKDFLLGADPEFIMLHGRWPLNAKKLTRDNSSYPLGADGNTVSFEIRPDPSKNPLELVANIRQILVNKIIRHPHIYNYKWISGSYIECSSNVKYPLGGHIHFGLGKNLDSDDATDRVYTSYSRTLSQYLGTCTVLLEKLEDGRNRRKSYGGLTDYESKDYGFEYRMPSSWITSPYIAAATLCLAKVVMHEILNRELKSVDCLYLTFEDLREMHLSKTRKNFKKLWNDIEKMYLYPKYKSYLELFPFLISRNLTWFPTTTMQEAWGLKSLRGLPKKKTDIPSIWEGFIR